MVWVGMFGAVSFEIFGQFQNVVGEGPGEREALFADACVTGRTKSVSPRQRTDPSLGSIQSGQVTG